MADSRFWESLGGATVEFPRRAGRNCRPSWTERCGQDNKPLRCIAGVLLPDGGTVLINGSFIVHQTVIANWTNPSSPLTLSVNKAMLKEWRKRGYGTVISTHILAFAEELADRIIVMERGEKIAEVQGVEGLACCGSF